jgi:ribosomal protein S18 acetylase RimI-like enzyme
MSANSNIRIERLDPLVAAKEADQLLPMMALVGKSVGTPQYLQSSCKGNQPLYGKWDHSRVLREREAGASTPAGLMLVYERPADDSPLYPVAELHLGVLAVSDEKQGRGYGSLLLRQLVDVAIIRRDFTYLQGPIEYLGLSVADDKVGPRKLYEAFGFEAVGTDPRDDGVMHIMRATIPQIIATPKYQQTPVL